MKPGPRLYIQREAGEAGPYDLVQMAGLLRKNIITGQTMTRLEGEGEWMPLSWQPQFSVVREMPVDAVSSRIDELDDEAADRFRSPIPLPSRETLARLGGLLLGVVLAGLGAFIIARLDTTTGYVLMYAGAATALAAHCLIMGKLLNEDSLTIASVFFVPGGDIFYFVSNFWQYFKYFAAKYGGACVAAGAAIGLGQHLR